MTLRILLTLALLFQPQSLRVGPSKRVGPTLRTQGAGAATVALDTTATGGTGSGNASYTISITVAVGHTNMVLLFCGAFIDTGAVTFSAPTGGGGGAWAQVGTTQTGNGNMKGSCWTSTSPSTGAQTITVNASAGPSGNSQGVAYSLYGASQVTPATGLVSALSGNLNVTISANDMAVSAHFDGASNRTVTGCTSSTDLSGFSLLGYSGAHCNSSPTSTFTWSGFGAASLALGVDINHA